MSGVQILSGGNGICRMLQAGKTLWHYPQTTVASPGTVDLLRAAALTAAVAHARRTGDKLYVVDVWPLIGQDRDRIDNTDQVMRATKIRTIPVAPEETL